MGIPADYNDKDYKGKVRTTPPVDSMLPIPKGPKASQECVGGNQKGVNLTNARPSESGSRAPIKLVDGRPWSPNNISQPQIDREEPRSGMGEGFRKSLSLLIINLRLLSYTRARAIAIPRAVGWNNLLHQH